MKQLIPLRRYLLLQFSMAAAVPVAVIAVLAWLFLIPQIRTNIGIQHESLARAIAGQISAYLMGGERQLKALAEYIQAQETIPAAQMSTLLDAECGDGDLFETIYLSDKDRKVIDIVGLSRLRRSARRDLLGLDISARRFYQASNPENKPHWSETFLSTASSRLAVALTIPLAKGVIIGEITLGQLSEFISHMPVQTGLLTMVLDRRGRIVADSQQVRRGQQLRLNSLPPEENGIQDGFASVPFRLDGMELLGTVVDISQLGWKVLVAQPIGDAYRALQSAFMMIAFGLVTALIMAMAVSWLRSGNLSQLFRVYSEHATAIARGQYELTWPPSKTREFEHLGENLDRMAQTIRQREQQLVHSETDLRITLHSIGDAVIATDAHGSVTRMNPMAERLTGWQSAEAAGRQLSEVFRIVNAYTRRPVDNPVQKVLELGEIVGLANHTMLISKTGQEYQIADSGAPIRHGDGKIIGVVLVFRDVTETYAQEQKIRQNEKMLQNITANVPGVVYQISATRDHAYTCRFVSPKAEEVFGITGSADTFIQDFTQCLPENEKANFINSIGESVDRFSPWHYEGRFIKPSGEIIWFSGNASPKEADNEILFYGVLMDITQRRQLEEALRITQFSFDKASFGIFRIDADARIVNVNDEAARSLGYSVEELATMSVFDIDPLVNSDNWAAIWQRLREQGWDAFETLHRTRDGVDLPVFVTSNLLEYGGRQFSVAFVQDITDQKKAEKEAKRLQEALLQAQKMEAIGTLAGGIAHDFNNILSAVIGYSELSLAVVESNSTVHSHLKKILTAGLRARDLVRRILTFSRKDERAFVPLQITPLIMEAMKLMRSSLPATVEINEKLEDGVEYVMADPTQIHQIIMNLCTNAAHAMEPDGGRLSVGLSQVFLSGQDIRLRPGLKPGDYAKLSIQDTGHGIPPQIMGKIYDPYFTTKESGKGTGLGLSVVHGIVQSFGGAIFVYSELGKGTKFNVYIPTVKSGLETEELVFRDLPHGNEHILLVDDEPLLLDMGRQMLENLGYRVSTAGGGDVALEMFRQAPQDFDLVLTDMTMPKLTGEKLSVELLKIRPDIPIILCTGYSVNMSVEKALKIGVRDLIFKPMVEAELAGTVRKALDENKTIDR